MALNTVKVLVLATCNRELVVKDGSVPVCCARVARLTRGWEHSRKVVRIGRRVVVADVACYAVVHDAGVIERCALPRGCAAVAVLAARRESLGNVVRIGRRVVVSNVA